MKARPEKHVAKTTFSVDDPGVRETRSFPAFITEAMTHTRIGTPSANADE
jgi:hypothetical protein